MNFKTIDTKMKEIYINTSRIEADENEKRVSNFWKSMNMVAITNMSMQQIKYA